MHSPLLRWVAGGVASLLTSLAVSAQTPDPGFVLPALRQAAVITSVAVQPDGKRVVASWATEAEGQSANQLLRYNADGTLDQGFRTAVSGYAWAPQQVLALRNGKLLVTSATFQAGLVQGVGMLRLNADGSADAGFQVAGGANSQQYLAWSEQADGKVLVSGVFTQFGSAPAQGVVRLLADGSRDPAYLPPTFATANPRIMAHALQPDGKLLITGLLNSTTPALVRLHADGSPDASFAAASPGTIWALAVQPDGKIIISTTTQIRRLLPNGAADNSFTPLTTTRPIFNKLLVQPDGSILAASSLGSSPTFGSGNLIRILPSGARDASFQIPASWRSPQAYGITGLARQADGRVLVGTNSIVYPTGSALHARTLLLLEPSGALSTSWQPLPLAAGATQSMALQADGSLLVGGNFTRCDNAPVGGILRLHPDGRADTAFNRKAAVDGTVYQVKLHGNNRVLIGGDFARVGTVSSQGLVRLLPSGELDPTFVYQPGNSVSVASVKRLGVATDGSVSVQGIITTGPSTYQQLQRLLPSGQPDPAFTYSQPDFISAASFLPDGRAVVATSNSTTTTISRLLPTGAPDPSFAAVGLSNVYLEAMAVDAQDRLVFTYITYPANGNNRTYRVVRYTANTNAPDASFAPVILRANDFVLDIVEQPNGRLLLTGLFPTPNDFSALQRVLPDGQPDASFTTSAVTGEGHVTLVQPDGKLLIGGFGLATAGQTPAPLLRLTTTNVLTTAPAATAAATSAWPVPARSTLHLRLDAAAHPQQVSLLDALGRPVLSQAVGQAEASLNVRHLPAGVYLLRVQYAKSIVTRRVVVE